MFKEEDSDHSNDDDDDRNVQFKKANVGYFDENDKENISGISYIKNTPNMITNFPKVTNAAAAAQGSQDPCPRYNPIPVGGAISTPLLNGGQQQLETIFENNSSDKNKGNFLNDSFEILLDLKKIV